MLLPLFMQQQLHSSRQYDFVDKYEHAYYICLTFDRLHPQAQPIDHTRRRRPGRNHHETSAMKLLSRSKSKHDLTQERSQLRAVTRDGPVSGSGDRCDERRINTSHRQPRELLYKDDRSIRPQTADAVPSNGGEVRFSLFEPFEFKAGGDVFAFPKPQSARTVPPNIAVMAASPPTEPSPMIGLAFGSPSHPPTGWHDFQQKQKGMPTATQLDTVQDADESRDSVPELIEQTRKPYTWRRFGSLFKRPTKSQQHRDAGDMLKSEPGRPRRSNTDPMRRPGTSYEKHMAPLDQEQVSRASQDRARSIAKMKYILGVDDFADHDEGLIVPSLAAPPPPHSRPFNRRDQALPDPPKYDETRQVHRPSTSVSTHSSSLSRSPPRLELALPSFQLERYSVMFEGLLGNRPNALGQRRRSRLQMMDPAIEDGHESPIITRELIHKASSRRGSSPILSPAIDLWLNSPIPPSPLPKDTPPRSPRLERPNISPSSRPSPLRTSFGDPNARDGGQSRLTFFDSSSSEDADDDNDDDEDEEDHFSPQTPQNNTLEDPKVKVFSDSASHHTTAVGSLTEHKEMPPNIWHAVVPPVDPVSPRYASEMHHAPDSPSLLARSKSDHGASRGRTIESRSRESDRRPQVRLARSISVSKLQNTSLRTGSTTSLRPKVVRVGAQAHSRKSSFFDSDNGTLESNRCGVAL